MCSYADIFMNAYVTGKSEDPHKVFADDLGISRSDAKVLCYKTLYESKFLRTWAENLPAAQKENENGS